MIELLTKYPKAAKVVREHFLEKLLESLKADLPEEFKDHVREQGVKDEDVINLIGKQPRILFDVFDENKIYIGVSCNPVLENNEKENIVFRYTFNGKIESNDFSSRKEAELEAIKEAFELLEEKL